MTVSVERCPSPNFVTDVMILHSTQYDVEDDMRGEIGSQLWEEFGYELLPTDCHFRYLTKRAPQLEAAAAEQGPTVEQARMMCIAFTPLKAEELLTQFLRLNQCTKSRYDDQVTHDFVYDRGHISDKFRRRSLLRLLTNSNNLQKSDWRLWSRGCLRLLISGTASRILRQCCWQTMSS
jgi:hypothetical protein